MNERVTINISDDGKFNVKFNMPDIKNQEERENFLRGIGGIICQVFNKKVLPGVAKSFLNIDEDGRFLAVFIEMILQLKAVSDKEKIGPAFANRPLVPPSKVFSTGSDE